MSSLSDFILGRGTGSDGAAAGLGPQVLRKVSWRLLPPLVLLYTVSFIDRVNIGVAALAMNSALHLTATGYGLASGIFFAGYLACQVPASWMFHRLGMRRWLPVLLVAWGCCSAATGLVTGPGGLYAVRLALGAAEAGFYPAVLCYLGRWFPAREQARAVAVFLLAIPLANVAGAPVSALLVAHGGIGGLPGWRVMFLAEGLPAVVLGLLVPRLLPGSPHQAGWLTRPEQDWLAHAVAAGRAGGRTGGAAGRRFATALTDPRLLLLALVNAGLYFGLYSVQFFLPQILVALRPHAAITWTGWATAACYVMAALGMLRWSRHSDRAGERAWHLALPPAAGAVTLAVAITSDRPAVLCAGIAVAATAVFATIPVFWSLPAAFLSGASAAAGIAVINSLSSIASFAGPYITGALKDATGGYTAGLLTLACVLALTAVSALAAARTIPQPSLQRATRHPRLLLTSELCQAADKPSDGNEGAFGNESGRASQGGR